MSTFLGGKITFLKIKWPDAHFFGTIILPRAKMSRNKGEFLRYDRFESLNFII